MKAILIARVSTEEQKEAGNSLPAQIARLERYCQSKNFTILKICSFDESAYSDQRSEFDRIIDFILSQKEKIAVCCDKVDRLSRNIFDKRISTLYEQALNDEIELHFASEGQIITSRISAVEKFQFGISLGLAKYYSDAISDNVKRAREQILRKGEWPSKAPFGYKNTRNGDRCDIIVSDYEATIVRLIFELYGTGAYSMNLLRIKLKKDYNLNWSKGFIDHVLKNSFYYGIMVCKGTEYPHRYPTLITKELFDKVTEVKSGFQKKKFHYAGKPYIYRGLLRCDTCNLTITPEKHKGLVYYHCTQYNGKHDAPWIREEDLTKQFEQFFKKLQLPTEIHDQIIHMLNEVEQQKTEFYSAHHKELSKEHKILTTMMDNLYLDKLKGRITESEYDKFYQTFKTQLDNLNAKIVQLQEADDNYYILIKHVLGLTNKAYNLFVGSEVDEKRQLLKFLLQNLRLSGKNIVYDVQKPFNLIVEASDRQVWCAW
jgi:site-specific DNA recombinase